MKNYIALFEENGKGGYSIVFPDFPGCISAGDSYNEALKMAHEALSFHINGLKEDNCPIPAPRCLEQIKANWPEWSNWKNNYSFIAFISVN